MADWKRNFIVIWIAQFLSMTGFSFSMPFAPFYMQELGVTDPVKLKFWISIFSAATPLSLAIFAPIWGAVADMYGRRMMLLRANFAGAVVISLMGLVPSVEYLIALRLLQGVFTGTVTAAQTMVSVDTPQEHSGFALGALTAAIFSGNMFGSFAGGFMADFFGYRVAFFGSGVLLVIAGLVVLLGAREKFVRPVRTARTRTVPLLTQLGPSLPILVLLFSMALVRSFDNAFLPLLVQDIQGSIKGAAAWTGTLSAVCSVAGLLAGIILGRLADRMPPPRIGKYSAFLAGMLTIPQALIHGFFGLFAARFGMVFFSGGLDPVFQIWLAKVTPEKQRGFIFGWAATAKSIGWMIAPLASGVVAGTLSVRAIFFFSAALYLLLIPLINIVVRYIQREQAYGEQPAAA
jgi:DHA1 family multidrug resistance protein-like MFS transporter